jgi:hypothetical protein
MLAVTERRRRPEWGWSKLAYEQREAAKPSVVVTAQLELPMERPTLRLVHRAVIVKGTDPRRSVYLPPVGSMAWSLLGAVRR